MTIRDEEARVLGEKMQRAKLRCRAIGDSERVQGYRESSETYYSMAAEFSGLSLWVLLDLYHQSLIRARKSFSNLSGQSLVPPVLYPIP